MNHSRFTHTNAYKNIKNFIKDVDRSIRTEKQANCKEINNLLEKIANLIEEIPLDSKRDRYANSALKIFYERLTCDCRYLNSSFGNAIRLDYGTGHELNFFCYIYTLHEKKNIKTNEVFTILVRYFRVIRSLIVKFNVEPAGSHGFWGLDDYQFLPFLFGASELHNSGAILDTLDAKSCFGEATLFLKESKGQNIGDHSPKLYGLRNLSWNSVFDSLFKLYDESVLSAGVVTQHFIFGDFLDNKEAPANIRL